MGEKITQQAMFVKLQQADQMQHNLCISASKRINVFEELQLSHPEKGVFARLDALEQLDHERDIDILYK